MINPFPRVLKYLLQVLEIPPHGEGDLETREMILAERMSPRRVKAARLASLEATCRQKPYVSKSGNMLHEGFSPVISIPIKKQNELEKAFEPSLLYAKREEINFGLSQDYRPKNC